MANPYKDTATYWGPLANSGTGGKAYALPVQLICNWQDEEEQFIDGKGELSLSKAVVYFPKSVSGTLDINGYLLLGVSNVSNPSTTSAQQIRGLVRTSDIRRVKLETRALL